MTIFEILIHPGLLPFEIAGVLVIGLLILEVVVNQIGLSLFGAMDAEADADVDADLEMDFDAEADALAAPDLNLDADSDFGSALEGDLDGDIESGPSGAPAAVGLLSWLGLGQVPLSIWLTGMATAFAIVGYALQVGTAKLFGQPLGAGIATAIALVPSLAIGGRFARFIGALFPKSESTAISSRSYGRRRGVITVGTATADNPAQVRIRDAHGNFHYAMVVPMDPKDELPQGTEVAIFRSRDGLLKAVRISD